jgi:hypothetical protein
MLDAELATVVPQREEASDSVAPAHSSIGAAAIRSTVGR